MSSEHISATNRFEIEVQGSNITVSLPSALLNANQPTFIAKLPITPGACACAPQNECDVCPLRSRCCTRDEARKIPRDFHEGGSPEDEDEGVRQVT
jgi:hypothetical protein